MAVVELTKKWINVKCWMVCHSRSGRGGRGKVLLGNLIDGVKKREEANCGTKEGVVFLFLGNGARGSGARP